MSIKLTEKLFNYTIISSFLAGFIIVINNPIQIVNDSEGYLNMVITRSASYPIFLQIIRTLFGSYFNTATIILQYILGVGSIYVFISTLKKYYKLELIWLILLNVILLIPYLYNHKLANVFLSEALAYPLYLITISLFLKSILTSKIKPIIIALPILLILIQTRSQFLFLVPIAIGILLWFWYQQKKLENKWLLALLLVFPILSGLTDKTYHKIAHNHFVSTPWTGIHLLTPAFFVADSEDFTIYKSKVEQDLFRKIYSDLAEKHLNINEFESESNITDELPIYVEYYADIANFTILPAGMQFADSSKTNDEKLIEVDLLTKQMSTPLILNNFKPWLKLYFKNFVYAFGNAKYALLLFIILIFSFIKGLKTNAIEYKIILFISLLSIGNVALISIGMHTLKRFTFYNDWVFFLIFFILISAKNLANKPKP
ncbi:hypothetical protein [Formosa sp. PL04]|uniref:hypothetical protein n=1 Tax=Formosa sp. PL04 TaxID=3081755 RepID=UPI00298202C4|nr:hypothetical protein [Formosa sp. PL04]MDW5288847.1 hypothetical protein [Formosa sp. PL04]